MEQRSIRRDPWARVGLASALGFVLLGAFATWGGALALDVPLAAALQGLALPTAGWVAATSLGGSILFPLGFGVVVTAALSGRFRLALILAVVLIGGSLVTDLTKGALARPRPSVAQLIPITGFSFPSGHALNSATAYGVIALLAWRSGLRPAVRRAVVVGCAAAVVLVGLSRIALGVHYPTDVAGGWLAGLALVALGAVLVGRSRAMERVWRPGRGRPRAALARREDNGGVTPDVLPDGRVDRGAGDTPS